MQIDQKPYRFIVSGGGTGGHIFPALAIANELKSRLPNARFQFIGALGKMEMEKVPKAGYEIIGLPITGIQRKLSIENIKFPFKLLKSISMSKKILKEFSPDVVIGTGGYASGPMLLAAQQKNIPTIIQEQNAFPGITNKRLGKKAKRVFVSYDHLEQYFPSKAIRNFGNPVRLDLFESLPSQQHAKAAFGLDVSKPVVLSVGGSLGSRTLNNVWKDQAVELLKNNTQLIWQTGSLEYQSIPTALKEQEGIAVREFIYQMDQAYAAADLIISRAGAIAISELAIVAKPIILVPFPFAAEDHQTKNAASLAAKGAALLIKDEQAREKLVSSALDIVNDTQKSLQMSNSLAPLGKLDATKNIVNEIIESVL